MLLSTALELLAEAAESTRFRHECGQMKASACPPGSRDECLENVLQTWLQDPDGTSCSWLLTIQLCLFQGLYWAGQAAFLGVFLGPSWPCTLDPPAHLSPLLSEYQAWTALLLLGTCLLYGVRVAMPVCAAAMSQDFGWSKREAGTVLSSFFWGYCLTQVVGGHLGDRIGGEKVILFSASAWGFITVATPLLGHLGSARLGFITSRMLTGLLQGVYFPALTSLLTQRVRESERALAYSTVGVGSQLGMLVMGAAGSLLLDWCGWQSVFYFSGGLTLLWVCYLYRHLLSGKDPVLAPSVQAQGLPVARPSKVPWRLLFRNPSVWVAILSQLSSACSFFILLSWLPTFFKETFPHSKGWIFNVVPWLVAIPASLFSGFLSDHLIAQGFRTIAVRKCMQVVGLGLSSMFALCLGHTRSFPKAVIFASASISLQTFNHSGISVHIQDLAPSCAGFLFGVANTAGALAGVVGVCLGGYLIEATGSWTCVFHLVAIVNNLGLGTFLACGQAQRVDLSSAGEDV
ncbi:voltage-gated purine nucleotide uniporter SLC17A9 [Thomomys bottae]